MVTKPTSFNPSIGGTAGREPVEMQKRLALTAFLEPSAYVSSISCGDRKRGLAKITSTPQASNRSGLSCSPTVSITRATRSVIEAKTPSLNSREVGAKPKSLARRTSAANRAERINVFEGTHPVYRQSPPSNFFSTRATRAPSCAAPPATTSPAEPPPITTRSYLPMTLLCVHYPRLLPQRA